jgi:hypothetical protein
MKTSLWAIALGATGVLFASSAQAQCTRHVYNNSPYPFRVGLTGGLCNGSPICTVRPRSTATITYLMMPGGSFNAFAIYNGPPIGGAFGMSGCYIFHRGSTGAIAVNSPADGDVTTCGGSSCPCPQPYRTRVRAKR